MPQTIPLIYPQVTKANWIIKEETNDAASEDKSLIKNPHDKVFKLTLGDVNNAKDFLHHYLPKSLLEATNLNTLEPQKDSFINKKLEENYSDLLFKAKIHNQPGYFYFLFEHKSYSSKNIVFQLLSYMLEIWKTKANKANNWEVPIVIPLVIYHGKNNWNSPQNLGKMIVGYDLLPENLKIYVPDFEYIFYNLTGYSDEEIKGSAQLRAYLTICRDILTDDEAQFISSVFKAVDYLLEIEDEETRLAYLKLLIDYIFQAGKNLSEKNAKKVIKKIPEGSEIVMTLAEKYRNEGREEGREEITIEFAKKLILKELNTKDIIDVTGLTEKEIERLQKEMKQ